MFNSGLMEVPFLVAHNDIRARKLLTKMHEILNNIGSNIEQKFTRNAYFCLSNSHPSLETPVVFLELTYGKDARLNNTPSH